MRLKLRNKAPSLKNKDFVTPYDELDVKGEILQEIVYARNEKRINQREFAKQLGIAQSALARFESGRTNPTLSFLQKVMNKLGLELTVIKV